jgi:tetratricopeptide (TPR) repeat protein
VAIDREKVLSAAQKLVEKKKYDKAVLEYQKIIQEDPNDARTLLKIGDLQSKMEAYDGAVATYERVGKYYAQQGFALKAIAVYKQIREIIAKHVPALEERYAHITPKLAELYVQLGLTSDALAALDEVATRMQRAGRDGDAIQVFRKIVELDPTNPLPHLRLAEALSRSKDIDGAVTEFGIAATQLVKLGRRDDAIKVVERLLHHKQDAVHARIAAELYLARAQPHDGMQALAKLQVCFQSNPKDLDTLGLLARAFNAIGQAAKAIEVQKEMARLAQEQGKTELFGQLVERLVKLAPNDEGVKRIVASISGPSSTAQRQAYKEPEQPSHPTEDIDEVEELEPDADEQPFEMRPSARPPAPEPEEEFEDVSTGSLSTDVVVESSIEIVEEVGAHDEAVPAAVRTSLARLIADAAGFRRQRFFAKAIETLRRGLELAPRSLEVRTLLRDVLLEAGMQREAIVEMLAIASMLIDVLDGDAAAQTLQDVLGLDPQNARAADMLRELGYELVEEPQPAPTSQRYQADLPPMREQYPSYDPEAPLPSYDLEEIGPEAVSAHYSEPPMHAAQIRPLEEMDDPFAEAAPLPQFPLEAPVESEAKFDLVSREPEPYEGDLTGPGLLQPEAAFAELAEDDLHTDVGEPEPVPEAIEVHDEMPAEESPTATRPQPTGAELEEALEEADFFASRGLYDDARTILEEQLARLPKNRLVMERLAELEVQERNAQVGSGTREKPNAPTTAPPPVDRSFDIAQSLGEIEHEAVPPSPSGSAFDKQVDVEEVFAKFKEGVAKQISVDDAQSHYDLGVAYKEMGLIDDAIRELETAGRDPKRECICRSMIGMIEIERGNVNEAIDAFMRGLHATVRTPDQEMALCFEIGAAYEAKKMNKDALGYYQRVQRRDPNYRDVGERIRRVSGTKQPVRAAAVGADDEFDRAFDDIIGGGKLP